MDAWLLKYRGYLILLLVEAILFGALFLWRLPQPTPIEILDPTPRPAPTPAAMAIYVSGAVQQPDVYTLLEGSRLKDALQAAGGARTDADLSALNLAAALQDGQRVHVPVLGEAPVAALADPPPPASTTPLDINSASPAELDGLPGIGPALAQRIVDDREANGPYETVDQLARVRGIGPALVEQLRPLVCAR